MNKEKIELKFRSLNPDRTTLIWRLDGRLEWMCEHGVGHTVFAPKIRQDDGTIHQNWIHDCDGCCSGLEIPRWKDVKNNE